MSRSTSEPSKPGKSPRASMDDLLASRQAKTGQRRTQLQSVDPAKLMPSRQEARASLDAALGAVAIEHAGTGAGRTQWTEKAKLVAPDPSGRKTVAQLDEALLALDAELAALDPPLEAPIEIKAIGGYALVKQGVRREERAFTLDIDTMTMDYSPRVNALIESVGQRLGMTTGWLNNDNLLDGSDPENVAMNESQINAKWIVQDDMGLSCIKLSIADIPTLTRSKIAAADIQESGRDNDLPDLQELFAAQRIETYGQFDAAYGESKSEHYTAHRLIAAHFGVELPARQRGANPVLDWADDVDASFEELGDPWDQWEDVGQYADDYGSGSSSMAGWDDEADRRERDYEHDDW